jgi:hypothetical protein
MGSKWILAGRVWNGLTWLRIGTGGELLWTKWWTFVFWCHGVNIMINNADAQWYYLFSERSQAVLLGQGHCTTHGVVIEYVAAGWWSAGKTEQLEENMSFHLPGMLLDVNRNWIGVFAIREERLAAWVLHGLSHISSIGNMSESY